MEINNSVISKILEEIRGRATVWLGLVNKPSNAGKVSPAISKVAIVGSSLDYMDIYRRA